MGLNKKETQKSKQTVIIQPIVKEKESGSATPVTPTTTAPKLNRRGEPYLKGKQLAAAAVSALPIVGCALSALNNTVDANHKIKKENLKGKAKTKVVAKTTGKVAIKYAAGIIGSYCTLQSINDTFDLS